MTRPLEVATILAAGAYAAAGQLLELLTATQHIR